MTEPHHLDRKRLAALRERVDTFVAAGRPVPVDPPTLLALLDQLAHYEHLIGWDTTCAECAVRLDAAYAEHVASGGADVGLAAIAAAVKEGHADGYLPDVPNTPEWEGVIAKAAAATALASYGSVIAFEFWPFLLGARPALPDEDKGVDGADVEDRVALLAVAGAMLAKEIARLLGFTAHPAAGGVDAGSPRMELRVQLVPDMPGATALDALRGLVADYGPDGLPALLGDGSATGTLRVDRDGAAATARISGGRLGLPVGARPQASALDRPEDIAARLAAHPAVAALIAAARQEGYEAGYDDAHDGQRDLEERL